MKAIFFAHCVNPRLKHSFFDKKSIIQNILLGSILDSNLCVEIKKPNSKNKNEKII
jgi:hypothetical protein